MTFLDIDHDLKMQYTKVLSERVVILFDYEDELVWTKNISGKCTVKDGYNSLMRKNDLLLGLISFFGTWPACQKLVLLPSWQFKIGF